MKFLKDDVYDFLGQTIVIRSNSYEALAHLRFVYGRFYQEKYISSSTLTDEKNHSRISDLEIQLEEEKKERESLEKQVTANKDTLAEWRNKAIGIGIGSGAGTGGVLFALSKLIESISGVP